VSILVRRDESIDHLRINVISVEVIVEHGNKPGRELIERANGIRERWIDYWATTTGHRWTMTANPK
jgi:hypothetical protein